MIKENRARVVKDIHVSGVSNVHGVSYDGQHVWFAHGDAVPVIDVAAGGVAFTDIVRGALVPHALLAVTFTVPVTKLGL